MSTIVRKQVRTQNPAVPPPDALEQRIAELEQQNALLQQEIARLRQAGAPPSAADGLLQAMLDSIPDRIYFKDAQSRFIKCSRTVAQRLGVDDPSQVIGKSDFDFLPPDRARDFYQSEQELIHSGRPFVNKIQKLTSANGDVLWSSVTKAPLRAPDGTILGLVGINRDITEQKLQEEALRQSNEALEQRVIERTAELTHERLVLRTLIDNLPDSIYVKDLNARKVLANPANVKRAGRTTEAEVLGKTDFELFPPEIAARFAEDDRLVLREGQSIIDREEQIKLPNGRVRWTLTTKVPWRDATGAIIGLVGIGRDITHRKEAEEALARERQLLRTLIDNLPDCIYAKDTAGRKTLSNPADMRNLRCKTEAEALGKDDFAFFPQAVAEKFWADDQRVLKGEPIINREEFCYDDEGEKRWLLTSKLPLRDGAGNITGLIGIARDITVIKHAEEKLAEHMRELEQRDHQTKEELNMARELQMAMLPHEFPAVSGNKFASESDLEFFSFFSPAGAVSGDFFDVVPLSDTAVGIFICDAMGHDVRAALVTAMMRALVADLSATVSEPGELLMQVNQELTGIFKQSGSIMYATAFYLIVDLARREFRYTSAGHPNPILIRRKTNTVEWLKADDGGKKGPALGLFANGHFPTYRRAMESGDVIALYTDGLVEAENEKNEIFDSEHLLDAIRHKSNLPAAELFNQLINEVKRFSGRTKFDDDLCIAGVEVR